MSKDKVSRYLAEIGRRGGKTKGQVKCRGNAAYYAKIGRAGVQARMAKRLTAEVKP